MPLIWKPRDKKILQHWIDVIVADPSDEVNDWESSFIDNIQATLRYGILTEKQEDKLKEQQAVLQKEVMAKIENGK